MTIRDYSGFVRKDAHAAKSALWTCKKCGNKVELPDAHTKAWCSTCRRWMEWEPIELVA